MKAFIVLLLSCLTAMSQSYVLRIATNAPSNGDTIVWSGSAWVPSAPSGGGSGTVTNVGLSTSLSGLTVGNSPVTTGGTITLSGTLGLGSGGTGATDAPGARTALSLVPGTDVQAYDVDLAAIAALANSGIIVRTGAGTVSARTITGDSEAVVSNGDGVSGNPTLSIGATIARDSEVAAGYQPLDADLTAMAAGTAVATAQTNAVSFGAPALYVGTTNVAAALAAGGGGGITDGGTAASLTITNLTTENVNGRPYYDPQNGDVWSDGYQANTGVAAAFYPWQGVAISSGTSAQDTAWTGSANDPVRVTITSAAGANSGYAWTTTSSSFLLAGSESFNIGVYVHKTNSMVCRLGYLDAASAIEPTDGLYIEGSGGVLYGRSASSASRSSTPSVYVPEENSAISLRCVGSLNAAGTIGTFTIYTNGVAAWTDVVTNNIPTGAGRYTGHGVVAYYTPGGSGTNLMSVGWLGAKMNRSLSR